MAIKEDTLGAESVELVPVLDRYATVLRALKRVSEANLVQARKSEILSRPQRLRLYCTKRTR